VAHILIRVGIEQTASFYARRDQCAHVSAFVEAAVRGMDDRLVMQLRLAIEELFLNTVTHGHGGDTDAPVEVTVLFDGDRVALVYVDTAPPFDPFAAVEAPDAAAPLEARPVGHLGVFLITALAERYHYARAGDRNRVTVELRVSW
jgi:anti-sigma regulatory factor (Ser/Thr protein kinase)